MKKNKPKTQADIIKSIRRELAPAEKTFEDKKKKLYRKRKHKKVDISQEEC